MNDVTARDIQVIGGNLLHLCHSKSFETFCPTGPWVETELDAHSLDIELRINGEVQTPLLGPVADELSVGDRVYFRHIKAGELCERFNHLHLVAGDTIVEQVPTYRGEGKAFL